MLDNHIGSAKGHAFIGLMGAGNGIVFEQAVPKSPPKTGTKNDLKMRIYCDDIPKQS